MSKFSKSNHLFVSYWYIIYTVKFRLQVLPYSSLCLNVANAQQQDGLQSFDDTF